MKTITLTVALLLVSLMPAFAAKKNIHIIYSSSSHGKTSHNNTEVASLIKFKFEQSKYKELFNITSSLKYPDDESLVEKADLIIISSDGGANHALRPKGKDKDVTSDMKKLDAVLKKNKTGLIVIHWATDAPSIGFGKQQPENDKMTTEWIGACYFWVNGSKAPTSTWTKKPTVVELKVGSKGHPITNGLPEKFKLQDEFYYNFFTDGEKDKRNPVNDRVSPIHLSEIGGKGNPVRDQPVYWAFTRANQGRSVAMTSAHYYHTWANPHFFKTFANSVFWALDIPVPSNGVDIATPTIKELLSMSENVAIELKAQHFK